MKPKGISLLSGTICKSTGPVILKISQGAFFAGFLLLGACRPAPEAAPSPTPIPKAAGEIHPPASVVSIPEEFNAPPPPAPVSKPVLPRVVFATSDFQVTTHNGIQGIRAGEAVNFLREEGDIYVVQYGALEFKKPKSFFAVTYVPPHPAESTPTPDTIGTPAPSGPPVAPAAEEAVAASKVLADLNIQEKAASAPADSAESPLPGEPPLSGTVPPQNAPSVPASQKKVGDLTDSIRNLNDQIRTAQDELEKRKKQLSPQELKKASRAIQKLKAERDELSGQLTDIGKP